MPRWIRLLLTPATRLMSHSRLPVKLTFLVSMLLLPLLVVLGTTLVEQREQWIYTNVEHDATQGLQALQQVAAQLIALRARHGGAEGGTSELATSLDQASRALALPHMPSMGDAWTPLQSALREVVRAGAAQGQGTYELSLQAVRQLQYLVAERSGLLLDPEASSYLLMDLLVERTVPWLDALGALHERSQAPRGEAGAMPEANRAVALAQVDQLTARMGDLRMRLDALRRSGRATLPAAQAALQATAACIERMRALFATPGAAEGAAADAGAASASAIKSVQAFGNEAAQALMADLVDRGQRHRDQALKLAVLCALALLAMSLLCLGFYRQFIGGMRAVINGMQQMAEGNLAYQFQIRGRDEIADLARHAEATAARLSAIVSDIRGSADLVAATGDSLVGGSQALARRTEDQAGSLRNFVISVEQISASVAAGADELRDLDTLTAELQRNASDCGQRMGDAVGTLDGLRESSRRVGEIVSTIDALAFQTNILALNAAVEAARAGDAGRGFAVVASEVRQLALRSAQASGQIRDMVNTSRQTAEATAKVVQSTGTSLQELMNGVSSVSNQLRNIGTAAAQHSMGLNEMSGAIGSLDGITKENAVMVHEARRAAETLLERADVLGAAVDAVRLRQGSTQEALDLVRRAMERIDREGLQGAKAALHSAEQGFLDRDLYIFVLDREGRYVLHGARPQAEGTSVGSLPGIDGPRFVRDANAAADAGGGWVDYEILNPASGQVMPKASWMQPLGPRMIIGCGIYRLGNAARKAATPA